MDSLPHDVAYAKLLERHAGRITKPDGDEGCWVWTGAATPAGYARMRVDGREVYVYRLFWTLSTGGTIPPGYHMDHLCRNPPCVNPTHVEPVTPRINALRGVGFSAVNFLKTHCPRGHEYSPENTYLQPNRPGRRCMACAREYQRNRRIRKAA